jgi:HK97 family phage prohead protease
MMTLDFPMKVKAVGDTGTIEGYASVFGVRDSYNEAVMPGAFSDSLARHKREGTNPLMLWQHNPDAPIGVWGDLADDGKGLYASGQLLVKQDVPEADKAYSLVKAGAVRGMSIGYREVDVEPSEKGGPRKLLKLDLMEVSIVSFPALRAARVETVKNENWDKLRDFMRSLRDGEPRPIKEFEDILRDADCPKAMATQIASVGYAKAIRSESEGNPRAAYAALKTAVAAFHQP